MQKNIFCLFVLFLLYGSFVKAQVSDNFSDGNFTVNPLWTGNTSDWIVNASNQLQSNNNTANSNFYLSTASNLASSVEWELYVKLTFNTSSTNYADIYLTASASDLLATSTTGYFVRLGGTLDEICLYKKNGTGIITKIIDGVDAVLNTSNNVLKIKVIRDAANQFTLLEISPERAIHTSAKELLPIQPIRLLHFSALQLNKALPVFFKNIFSLI